MMNRRADVDMQVKMREDPLYAIRKREEEVKRRLLENPVRMKQLQKTVRTHIHIHTDTYTHTHIHIHTVDYIHIYTHMKQVQKKGQRQRPS